MVIMAVGVPLFAIAYHQPAIVAPGLVLALSMPAVALQTPNWVYYREMDFLKQRRLQIWDPIVGFVVTCGLAVAGLGYWSLVIGTLAGSYAAAFVAVKNSPYKLGFAYEKGTVKEYVTFSWPLMMNSASGIFIAQIPFLFAQRQLGTAAVGAMTLAGSISLYANRVDELITNTLYPAICKVKDRADLLFETFTKSNRLALMWGMACGIGIALFADDLVNFVLGKHWAFAVPVIQIFAVAAGLNQFGFNWSAFYRALGRTRPIAVSGVIMLVAVMAFTIPLIYSDGVEGYAWGMAAATGVLLLVRVYYLLKLFPTVRLLSHALRAVAPTIPAALAVLALRQLESGSRSELEALFEIALYVLLLAAGVFVWERALLREAFGYLRGRVVASPV
jgi:PST family polysaccharide transporter